MPERKNHDLREFRLRAKLPQVVRYAALAVIVITIGAVLVGFYRERNKAGFLIPASKIQQSVDFY